MMAQQNPKRPSAKNKRHKLTLSPKDKWKQILKEVEKLEAPVSVIQTITVHLVDGTQVDIEVQDLLNEGMAAEDLEYEINEKLDNLNEIIKTVDFHISVDHVAKAIQPATDNLLKNL